MLTCAMQMEQATRAWLVTVPGSREQDFRAKYTVLVIIMISVAHNNYGWKCILHLIIYLFNVLQYFPL